MEDKEVQEKEEMVSQEVVSESEQVVESGNENNPTESEKVAPKVSKKREKKVKTEKVEESYEGLSDDEIYTKMQTEKLVQRKRKRKIATMVAMGFAFAIALVIIIMATVPVSLKPTCIGNDYTRVDFYNGTSLGGSEASFGEDDARFNQFKKTFNKAFGQSYLSALFSGSLFTYEIEEKHQYFNSVANELVDNNSYFVRLTYAKEHTLTYQSGKVYTSLYANKDFDGTFTFTYAYITVNSENGFKDTKVYIPVTYPSSEDTYAITITIRANTYKIRDAWGDFVQE